MKEIPILMSTPMMQANLAGRKTETRRIVKFKRELKENETVSKQAENDFWIGTNNGHFSGHSSDRFKSPYGKKGDLLWFRETWAPALYDFAYKADYSIETLSEERNKGLWRPSIHMPKAAARVWAIVEDVRIERLNEISEASAIAEGIIKIKQDNYPYNYFNYQTKSYLKGYTAKESYCSLWESINGENSWQKNPFVWVVKYKIISTTGKPTI